MVAAAAANVGEKMSSDKKVSHDKSFLEKSKSAVASALKTGERSFGRSWDLSSPDRTKALVDGTPSMSSSPLTACSSSLSGSNKGSGGGRAEVIICSPFTEQSPASSFDLSSSSFKSSLSSSTYASSQERESIGDRDRGAGEKEVKEGPTAEERKITTVVSKSGTTMNGDVLSGVTNTTTVKGVVDARQLGNNTNAPRGEYGDESSTVRRERESESASGKEGRSRDESERERAKHQSNVRGGGGDSTDRESGKLSMSRASAGSDSNESSCSSIGYGGSKPHKANDKRWEGIQAIRIRDGALGLSHFKLLRRLGCGDIGSVYLAELRGSHSHFAMKVMDKGSLASRKKLLRAQTEREILQSLDHPFLPTLYTHFESEKFLCLVMEFCSGGDLHTLRQRQPGKHFTEQAARFYAAEVLLALEYLHMMGVVYRDLKPENVLVREDGHIMLSDFDLSLKCVVSPQLVKSSAVESRDGRGSGSYCIQPACAEPACTGGFQSCAHPMASMSCVAPSCFVMKTSLPNLLPSFVRKKKDGKSLKSSAGKMKSKSKMELGHPVSPLPELIAEPTGARSMSFVGTHEYLAPEIIKGDGHGSAVDWWTFGIFLYELLFGKTPFKGSGNRATLFNVVGQPLKFPESATGQVSFAARDLIRGLLVKEPMHRLAFKRGASEIKAHPFFEGVNWALIRCTPPPEVPRPFEPGTSLSSSTLSEDTSVTRGAKVTSGQDSLNVSSNTLSGHKFDSDSSLKAGEKSNSNRSATQSTQSSGGSYLDFDFF